MKFLACAIIQTFMVIITILEVKVVGEIDPETGYVIDLKLLKDIIYEEVELRFDHKNLNLDTMEFQNVKSNSRKHSCGNFQLNSSTFRKQI
jgi:6-pyruvoyltetrahydropterin/6-carboxytetrahydropterin synthase